MGTTPKFFRIHILYSILLPLLAAALLDPSVTDILAARFVGHVGWTSAFYKFLEHFNWSGHFFFFALRAGSYLPLISISIVIGSAQPHWYWRVLIGGLLITICAEIYWTWDLVAIYYHPNHGHISSTAVLGFLVTPIFVGYTQLVCAGIIALAYGINKRIISHRNP